jgi:hypothetical protein
MLKSECRIPQHHPWPVFIYLQSVGLSPGVKTCASCKVPCILAGLKSGFFRLQWLCSQLRALDVEIWYSRTADERYLNWPCQIRGAGMREILDWRSRIRVLNEACSGTSRCRATTLVGRYGNSHSH